MKREAGYDPDYGDWEYFVKNVYRGEPEFTRGKLDTCIRCHEDAQGKDYLFRSYLP